MADEASLANGIESELPISFTKSTSEALEQGAICQGTNNMTATITTGDNDIVAGIVHTEVTAAEASASVSIYRRGWFRGIAGAAGVTFGKAIVTDTATSSVNRLVDASINDENVVGQCWETAASGVSFLFELNPVVMNLV